MAELKQIRGRIRAVRSMAKLTRAMHMVALSKMRRAQVAALHGIPYADLLNDILCQVTRRLGGAQQHALMQQRSGNRRLIVVVSTDRGLCGSLNNNIFREFAGCDVDSTYFVAVGARATQFIQRSGRLLLVDFAYGDPPRLAEARTICRFVAQLFLDNEIDSADIVFSDFISTMRQEALTWSFLPVGQPQLGFEQMPEALRRGEAPMAPAAGSGAAEFEFEPDFHAAYEALLLHTLDYQLLQILREVRASEHSARMIAMKTATDNAEDMFSRLELTHNNLRQAAITKELLELGSAAAAAGS